MGGKKISKQLFLFLALSALIWFLITLSKEYRTTLEFDVSFKNIPQNKLLLEDNLNVLSFNVKSNGFKILRTRIQNKTLELDLSFLQQNRQGKFYLLAEKQQQIIQDQLLSDVLVQSFLKDTLYLSMDVLSTKKVAVKPNIIVNYHVGYGLLNALKVTPDSILVSGSKNQLDTLKILELENITLNDVKENFEEIATIVLNDISGLKLETKTVTITGEVDKFTEGSVKIPFEIKGVPDGVKLTTLSEEVSVVFVVGLSDFNKILPSSFRIECDYTYSQSQNLTYLMPKLVQKPREIKSFKIVPQTIDFLIQK